MITILPCKQTLWSCFLWNWASQITTVIFLSIFCSACLIGPLVLLIPLLKWLLHGALFRPHCPSHSHRSEWNDHSCPVSAAPSVLSPGSNLRLPLPSDCPLWRSLTRGSQATAKQSTCAVSLSYLGDLPQLFILLPHKLPSQIYCYTLIAPIKLTPAFLTPIKWASLSSSTLVNLILVKARSMSHCWFTKVCAHWYYRGYWIR